MNSFQFDPTTSKMEINDEDRTVDFEGGFLLMMEMETDRQVGIRPEAISMIRFEHHSRFDEGLCHRIEITLNNGITKAVYAWKDELFEIINQVQLLKANGRL